MWHRGEAMVDTPSQQTIRDTLRRHGFRPVYETAAVTLLEHSGHPGSLVRLGVTRIVAERDGTEVYRAPFDAFSVDRLMSQLSDSGSE